MSFNIQNVVIGGQEPFFLLGPCSLENEAFAWEMATAIKEICTKLGVQFIFKASYDKANRTSVKSFRGPASRKAAASSPKSVRSSSAPW